jgi:hypothetical protein
MMVGAWHTAPQAVILLEQSSVTKELALWNGDMLHDCCIIKFHY